MRINKNTDNKKKVVIVSVIAALLIAGTTSALFIPSSPFALNKPQEDRGENTPDYNPPTDDQKKAGEKAKEDFLNRQDDTDKNNPPKTDPETTTNDVNITVSSANQNGQTYQLRTMIDGLDDAGICTLVLSKSGADPVTQEVGTQTLGSYSVCKGFDIVTANLQKGSWQAKITYKGSLGQGSTSQTVDIQ